MAVRDVDEEPWIAAGLSFLADCCRANFKAVQVDLRVPAELDWTGFSELARRHRVEGLVWAAIGEVSDPLPVEFSRLSSDAARICAHNLRSLNESAQLESAFKTVRIPLLILKGLPVGALAYRAPLMKSAIDIDLLIDPRDLHRAASILMDLGYRPVAPKTALRLRKWHSLWKESVWKRDDLRIDLHTGTADNPRLIPGVTVHSPQQSVVVTDGFELPTLALEEQFAYLAVHGASSAWFRLKWISDFAGLLDPIDPGVIDHLYRTSQRLGSGRAAGQALLLADHFFGTLSRNENLRRTLRNDSATVRLYSIAFDLLAGRRMGTRDIHLSQLHLMPGASFKVTEASGQLRRIISARVS